jgi:hypothetical protein
VSASRRPVVITQSGEHGGVLMDIATYQDLRQATLLLRLVAQGEADVREGRIVPQERVFRAFRGRLAKKCRLIRGRTNAAATS